MICGSPARYQWKKIQHVIMSSPEKTKNNPIDWKLLLRFF
jgi:hypothetical protein